MNQPKVTFICCYNNKEQLSRMLHTSIQNLDHSICTINSIFVDTKKESIKSAAAGYNHILTNYSQDLGDILIFAHQDIAFDNNKFLSRIINELSSNPLQILGFAGVTQDIKILSNLKYKKDQTFITRTQITRKEEVISLDECCFALTRELCLKCYFDEKVCFHWHLYAVDLCYTLNIRYGIHSYVLPEIIYHKDDKSTGLFTDKYYFRTMWRLIKKYRKDINYIYTTCFVCNTNPFYALLKILKIYFWK